MKMHERKMGLLPALLVAVLSFGGFVGAATIVSNNHSGLTPVSLANDGEDGGGEDGGDDNGGDSNDDKQSESDKKAKEASKKKAEREREAAKKANERSQSSGKFEDDGQDDNKSDNKMENESEDSNDDNGNDVSNDESGDDNGSDLNDESGDDNGGDVKDNQGDDNGMYKDRTKTLSRIDQEIAKAEEEILKKQAEGVDVTAALARLAEAKAKSLTAGSAFDSNDLETAKTLSKEAKKLAHFARNEDLHDAKDVAEKVSKVAKRISQTNGKIVLLEAVGGDASSFKGTLASYQSDLDALKAVIAVPGYDAAAMAASLETLERKVKRLKSSIEGSIYALGGTDSELGDDLENESDDVAEHLKDVADIEDDNVGRAIRGIAEDHQDAAKKMSEKVAKIDQRSPVLQTLFGASSDDLNSLEQEVTASKARTEVLTKAADAVEDPDVKAILLEQVATLKEQTSKLEAFIGGQRDRLSLFGWFFNLGK